MVNCTRAREWTNNMMRIPMCVHNKFIPADRTIGSLVKFNLNTIYRFTLFYGDFAVQVQWN